MCPDSIASLCASFETDFVDGTVLSFPKLGESSFFDELKGSCALLGGAFEISSSPAGIRQKSRNLTKPQHSLRNLAKFRKFFIKIGAKFNENYGKIRIFAEIRTKNTKKFDEFLRRF